MRSSKTTEKIINLNLDIYSREAIKLARNIFAKKLKTRFAWNKDCVKIFITPLDMNSEQNLEKEFLNEILNQQCRLNIQKSNEKIAKIIYTRALLSGLGK